LVLRNEAVVARPIICDERFAFEVRLPTKPAMHSNMKPATYSDPKPAGVPI